MRRWGVILIKIKKMSKYFTLEELARSAVAKRCGIDNTPPADIAEKLAALIGKVLDPVRHKWGSPITVNSGYRCPALNSHPEVGGAKNSQHTKGEAADITAGSRELNQRLFRLIMSGGFEFDQLIDEKDFLWIHISYAEGRNRKQVLHL